MSLVGAVRLRALNVDVVADHRTEDTAGRGADYPALQLVPARGGTDDGTSGGADRRITMRMLDDRTLRGRIAVTTGRTARRARARAPSRRAIHRSGRAHCRSAGQSGVVLLRQPVRPGLPLCGGLE